jgi:hypothetical protein
MKCPVDNRREVSFGTEADHTQVRAEDEFRQQFKRSLSQCARHGFSVEECFGLIWEEISEKICLPETSQSQLYDELITWAKKRAA